MQHSMGDREMLQRFQNQLEIKQNELRQAEYNLRETKERSAKANEDVQIGEREVGSLRLEIKSLNEYIDSLIDI